ncbi:unnamed protein product [Closterium sp. NIES-54]
MLEDSLAAAGIVASIHERIEPAAEPELVDAQVGVDKGSGGGIPSPPTEGGDDGSSGYGMQRSRSGRGCGFSGAERGAKKDDDSNDQQGGTGWMWGQVECWNQKNGTNMVADSFDDNPKDIGSAEKKKERAEGQFFHVGDNEEQGDGSAKVGAELHPLDFWVLDTGAVWTMTPRKDLLDELRAAPINEVAGASRHALKEAGAGQAAFNGADGKSMVLHDILLIPNLKANLTSLHKLAKAGVSTSMDGAQHVEGAAGQSGALGSAQN